MMPGLSGEETLIEIRKNCALNAQTPIIVLTANAIVGAREKYIECGFTDYLSKPIDGNKLEKMIHKYLPASKIREVSIRVTDDGNAKKSDKQMLPMDLQKTFDFIKAISTISVENGVKATGDVETYLNICKNFYETADTRIQMIQSFYDLLDLKNYTIQVHALKSSARLVGADQLSSLAFEMEMAGKEEKVDRIHEHTSELIDGYKELASSFEKAFLSKNESDKKELSLKKFHRRLKELMELLESFDFESAKELYQGLDKYRIPVEGESIYKALKAPMADVNTDEVVKLINQYFRGMKDA